MVAVAIESLKAVLPEEEIVSGTVDYRHVEGTLPKPVEIVP